MDKMKLYDALPFWLQHLACSAEGFRVRNRKYGAQQKALLDGFLERGNWSYEQVCAYRDQKLQEMVAHCYHHVPYYREVFDRLKIDYRSIRTLEDLKCLPILDKATVKANFEKLLADDREEASMMQLRTSGTTGSGFRFYSTKHAYAAQWADVQRYKEKLGITGKEWAAYFGGRSIVPKNQNKPPFYRINYPMKEYLFSAFHMTQENYPYYIEGLQKREFPLWHGYPSCFLQLAQYMLDRDIRLSYVPKWILLSSENVSEDQLDKMEKAFGIRPLECYALTEQVATFRQGRDGKIFVVEDLSAVELIPEPGDGVCRVVGTTLTNFAMPFLRYDTRDLVTWELTPQGRQILTIDGRDEDCLLLADGGKLRRLGYVFKDQVNITESQFVQKSKELVELHVVRGKRYSQADDEKLRRDLDSYLAGRIRWEICYVDVIPKTKNGKIKFIVSELPQ